MRKTLTTISLAISGFLTSTYAQQDPQFTQFMHCRLAYNPAYAGTSDAICFGGLYRQQWVNFPGAPKTGLINFDMPIPINIGVIGVGLTVMNDQLGFDNTTSARVAGAFQQNWQLPSGKTARFSIGLDAGILQKRINGNWIAPQTLNDPSIPNNPLSGGQGTNAPAFNKLSPDFGFGLYFTVPGTMYVGLSASHITAQDLVGAKETTSSTVGYALKFQMARHYYIIAGYHFLMPNGNDEIIPNIKVKSDGTVSQLDVNLSYLFNHTFWLGASYRVQDAIAPMLGFQRGRLKIGYSYDVTTSKLKGYSSGTHEIMLTYCINAVKPPQKQGHGNVRYLED